MDSYQKEERFIIFASVPPKFTEDRFAKYVEAGFNYYNLTEDWVTRDAEDGTITEEYYNAIDFCHQHGLKVILRTMRGNSVDYFDGITNEFAGKTQGFFMSDEPTYQECGRAGMNAVIDDMTKLVDWYNQYGGNTFWHVNLLQDYGIDILHRKLNITYEQYVDKYIEVILKNVKGKKSLTTDHYPLVYDEHGVNHIKETVLRDYYIIANRADKLKKEGHEVYTGFAIQLSTDLGLRMRKMVCLADITFQTNLGAAFGGRVYDYWRYVDAEMGAGLLNNKEEQTTYTPTYEYVREANEQLHVLGEELHAYDWHSTKVYTGIKDTSVYNQKDFALVDEFQPKAFTLLLGFESTADAVVSEFVSADKYAYMAVNFTEPTENINNVCTFTFAPDVKHVRIIKGKSVEICTIEKGIYSTTLHAGEAVFVQTVS